MNQSHSPLCFPPAAFLAALLLATSVAFAGPYPGWEHEGSMYVLTTPQGADLPASASEADFPLLLRLHKDFFRFDEAKAGGEDLRFSTADGKPILTRSKSGTRREGVASVWVRIPSIRGDERQEIKVYWGNADAASESSGPAVFGASNGYLSVWHMTGPVKDEVGTLPSKDIGTAPRPASSVRRGTSPAGTASSAAIGSPATRPAPPRTQPKGGSGRRSRTSPCSAGATRAGGAEARCGCSSGARRTCTSTATSPT